ncbi:hypothetical protein BO226_17555 [Rhodococcus sp. 2G]|uniref:hypothetical protein n=1 Tax=Rhodococcus sp. 2G TaxID=1570939 RepID=UPI0009032897|nr:hypothetical protein [Rhodococcus sp. 2G]APE10779.1 hypothetical protein BO226_17555 [Rhodococcus sp. 2G]
MTDSRNIIDEIDALVDEQMAGGEPVGGYDYGDPDYPRCPHCYDDWHGLPITERVREMRIFYCGCGACVAQLERYRTDEDDSPIWCPGSEFIGPWANQAQLRRIREGMTSVEWGPALGTWTLDSLEITRRSTVGNAAIAAVQSFAQSVAGLPYVWTSYDAEDGEREDFRVYMLRANGERTEIGVIDDEVTTSTDEFGREVYSFTVQAQRVAENLGGVAASVSEAMARLRCRFDDISTSARLLLFGDLTEAAPELPTPQERALPHPSEERPMWAVQPNRQRRRRNR